MLDIEVPDWGPEACSEFRLCRCGIPESLEDVPGIVVPTLLRTAGITCTAMISSRRTAVLRDFRLG